MEAGSVVVEAGKVVVEAGKVVVLEIVPVLVTVTETVGAGKVT